MVNEFDNFDPAEFVEKQRKKQQSENFQKEFLDFKYKDEIKNLKLQNKQLTKQKIKTPQIKRLSNKKTNSLKSLPLRFRGDSNKRKMAISNLSKAFFSPPLNIQKKSLKRNLKIPQSPESNLNKNEVMKRFYLDKLRRIREDKLKNERLSPSFRYQQEQLQQIQTKALRDNLQMQRRIREKNLLRNQMNLMKAHLNNPKVELDFTGVNSNDNILMAQNVFKEDPENNILKTRGRSILDTRENTLRF